MSHLRHAAGQVGGGRRGAAQLGRSRGGLASLRPDLTEKDLHELGASVGRRLFQVGLSLEIAQAMTVTREFRSALFLQVTGTCALGTRDYR